MSVTVKEAWPLYTSVTVKCGNKFKTQVRITALRKEEGGFMIANPNEGVVCLPVSHSKAGVASDLSVTLKETCPLCLTIIVKEDIHTITNTHTHSRERMQDYNGLLLLSKSITAAEKALFLLLSFSFIFHA